MFDNIGGKIKTLALVTCILGMAASVIWAIVLWCNNSYYTPTVWPGIGVLAGGCLASWIGAFFTYGFGQLIADTEAIRYELSQMNKPANTSAQASAGSSPSYVPSNSKAQISGVSGTRWTCKKCGEVNRSNTLFCMGCGEYK